MKTTIGIFSDTHGWLDNQLINDFSDCDEVWHAGDVGNPSVLIPWLEKGNLRGVYGNIDGTDIRQILPEFQFFDIQGFPILILHIAGKFPRYSPRAATLIRELKPKMLVCGHSHICRVVMEGGVLYVNPGAAGKSGFHIQRTALKLIFEEGKPIEMKVLELGKRA
ncbi:MAG TPA: metallophosphoesterase family protein [Catalimonadaceae bacterium]|nr:metallophosphoesterase family protein [Catalimonadaceae bacterium]